MKNLTDEIRQVVSELDQLDNGNEEKNYVGFDIAVDEMLEEKRVRHMESFAKEHPEAVKITSGANKLFYEHHED